MRKKFSFFIAVAVLFSTLLGFFTSPVDASALSYSFDSSASSVQAGSSFNISLILTNGSADTFYSVAVYLYQGHAVNSTTVSTVSPSYNATYTEPILSTVYNPGYWVTASMTPGASSTFRVTYMVDSDAAEGRLTTLGVSPIVSGAPIEEAEANPTSEMLVDVVYYTDPSAAPAFRKTIRNYVDLPSITQPLAAIASKTLPAIFTQAGSETTSISTLKKSDAAVYPNFTLDVKNVNKISWAGPLNLDDAGFLTKVGKLDQYIGLTLPGVISVNPEKVPLLDSAATITFKNVNFVATPILLKDEEPASSAVQTTGTCSTFNHTCAFAVDGFSEYKISPTVTITEVPEVGEASYQLEAFVDDLDATLKYKVNDGVWVSISEVDIGTGRFVANMTLNEGSNSIEVMATSVNDVSNSAVTNVTYTPGYVAPEDDEGVDRGSPANVVLIILAVAMVVVSVAAIVILWLFVYKKRKNGVTKVHTPKNVSTAVLSNERLAVKDYGQNKTEPERKPDAGDSL